MTNIAQAAKAVLARNTGFDTPRVVGASLQDGLYHVVVDIHDRTGGAGVILRTYDVALDESGALHGYVPLAVGNATE